MEKRKIIFSILVIINEEDVQFLESFLNNLSQTRCNNVNLILAHYTKNDKYCSKQANAFQYCMPVTDIKLSEKKSKFEVIQEVLPQVTGDYFFVMDVHDKIKNSFFNFINKLLYSEMQNINNDITDEINAITFGSKASSFFGLTYFDSIKTSIPSYLREAGNKPYKITGQMFLYSICTSNKDVWFPFLYIFSTKFLKSFKDNRTLCSIKENHLEAVGEMIMLPIILSKAKSIICTNELMYYCNLPLHYLTSSDISKQTAKLTTLESYINKACSMSIDLIDVYEMYNVNYKRHYFSKVYINRIKFLKRVKTFLNQ